MARGRVTWWIGHDRAGTTLPGAVGAEFGGFQDHLLSGGDDVLSIGYDELIGPLIKAIQELSARLSELEG